MTVRRFQPSKIVHQSRPQSAVTFTVNGTLNFNRALSVTIPDGFAHCELLVDDDPPQLIVKLRSEPGTDTLPLRLYHGYYVVSVRRFLDWAGWSRANSSVYQARYVERAGAVIVNLSKPLASSVRDEHGRFVGAQKNMRGWNRKEVSS